MIFAILSSFIIGTADAFSKYAVVRLKTGRLMIISSVIGIALSFLIFIILNGSFPSGGLFLRVFLLQIISSAAYLLYIIALLHGPVSIITAILASSSLFSVILGSAVLKESISIIQYMGIVMIITGSIGISYEKKNEDYIKDHKRSLWLILTLIAAVLWGIWAFLSKMILSDIAPYELGFANSLISPLLLLPYYIYSLKTEKNIIMKFKPVAMAVAFAVLVNFGLLIFYYSATQISISIASPIFCASPLFTAIASAIFFKEKLQLHQYIFLAIIITSMFLLAF